MKTSLPQVAKPQHPSKPRRNNRPRPKIPSSGQHTRRRFLTLAAGAAALPAVSRIARAQTYPSRPITMIVPFAAGGAVDKLGRVVAERMRGPIGQPIIIENVAGADGSIGVGRAAGAPPDGYTLVLGGSATHVLNGAFYSLRYDVLNDFAPVALLVTTPLILFAKKTLSANDLRELIAWLKANPNRASAGVSLGGVGGRLLMTFFQKETATQFTLVPYRGGASTLQELLAGQIDLYFDTPLQLPLVRGGSIKAYAVAAKNRLVSAPNVPTVDEAGLPGFYVSFWKGLWAPKGTPQSIIAKLDAAVVEALSDPVVRAQLGELGEEISRRDQQTPEALAAFQKAEIEKWWPIIKAAGIKAE
jgi:tripartite-type tricarboxylate transporter receptor subunit TctC